MDTPLLLVLLALPFLLAAVIVAVSSARRRRRTASTGSATEPRHRGQADSATVQSAVLPARARLRKVTSGRDRRADSARSSARD
ncbi:MAG TPA: hypothetical protein VNU01_06935 [Egibacteraceae bacterium]|nr:hypothetical protein [Egibacteraceae bacterium]